MGDSRRGMDRSVERRISNMSSKDDISSFSKAAGYRFGPDPGTGRDPFVPNALTGWPVPATMESIWDSKWTSSGGAGGEGSGLDPRREGKPRPASLKVSLGVLDIGVRMLFSTVGGPSKRPSWLARSSRRREAT